MVALPQFNKGQWFTFIVIGSVELASGLCLAIQAPFYPQEAESKGATATEYGLVFGVYELTAFISSPIFGKYMDAIGARVLLVSGIFVAAISLVFFGLLDYVKGHDPFIGLSFALRIVESLGASAAATACFSTIATAFPNSMATTFAALEVFIGVGSMIGPSVGSVLFTLGGFKLPFLVLGGYLLADGVSILFFLPKQEDDLEKERPQAQLWSFLKIPAVLWDLVSVTASNLATGYYSATLEPHIREFGLTPHNVGLVFMLSGGAYAITVPLVGILCDTRVNPKKVIVFGSFMIILSFLLVGPVPFTPLPKTLWMCCLGLIICGIGNSCLLVPGFIDAIRSATAHGLPDDITTYGVVSGLWASSFALGGFIGPSVAGALFDWVGFRQGTLFVIAVHALLIVVMVTIICVERRPQQSPPTPPTLLKLSSTPTLRLEPPPDHVRRLS